LSFPITYFKTIKRKTQTDTPNTQTDTPNTNFNTTEYRFNHTLFINRDNTMMFITTNKPIIPSKTLTNILDPLSSFSRINIFLLCLIIVLSLSSAASSEHHLK